jgi:hypothetical protein
MATESSERDIGGDSCQVVFIDIENNFIFVLLHLKIYFFI